MIDFNLPDHVAQQVAMAQMVAEHVMRPKSRFYDESEHDIPWEFVYTMWPQMADQARRDLDTALKPKDSNGSSGNGAKRPRTTNLRLIHLIEALSWGDAGMYLTMPSSQLAGAAIQAVGTPEQKERFLRRFTGDTPTWGAMCMTEPQCGSDTSAIRTTATRDGDEWVLNGTKIFVTSGHKALKDSNGIIVVWATVDPKAGRAGMKPFVVEAGTAGVEILKLEHKLGIRASDTAMIVFDNARIPADHILGNPQVLDSKDHPEGFKGAMKTFDATRPIVAASALGIARAAIEYTKDILKREEGIEIRYNVPRHKLTAAERDVIDMEAMHRAAWLLTMKAAWMMDQGLPNTLESSECKVKAGEAVTKITQKAVETLGPLGYSRDHLVEKWMRDAKINDIFEGTGQINRLVIARRILGYTSKELR